MNKSELSPEMLAATNLLLLGGPKQPFTGHELQHIRHYVENGGSAFIIMQEGGESRLDTNINAFLEQVGISVNGDSVIRKHFFKYLHPKEAFVGNGILNKELVRVAKGEAKPNSQKQGKYAKRYAVNKEELVERDENGGLKFVYPYGATLNVNKPAVPIMSTGPISFPANRPVGAFYVSPKRGKLFVLASMKFFHDDFFEKEDNQKIQEAIFKWLLGKDNDAEFENHIRDEPEISENLHVPDITALADRLRSCL